MYKLQFLSQPGLTFLYYTFFVTIVASAESPQGDSDVADIRTLRLVHVIFRHGIRAPSYTFPTSKYQDDFWKQGWGRLSPDGVKQQFELGSYLRQRYTGYLSSYYSSKELYVRSTDKDRTIDSAFWTLAGLYSPTKNSGLPETIPQWQPVPIHTVESDADYLLDMETTECNEYKKLVKLHSKAEVTKLNAEYADFFEFLQEKTGMATVGLMNIDKVYGPLTREAAFGLPKHSWVNETVMATIIKLHRRMKIQYVNTIEMARFRGGLLLGDILTRNTAKAALLRSMEKISGSGAATLNKKQRKMAQLKMQMYSAHDDAIQALLSALRLHNGRISPYGSCLMLELHEPAPGDFCLQIFYRNDTTLAPYPLTPPGCSGFECPLTDLQGAVRDTVLYSKSEWKKMCKLVKKQDQEPCPAIMEVNSCSVDRT